MKKTHKFLMRLDDASEYWDASKWQRMHDLLAKYKIKPLVAVIPKNEYDKLQVLGHDEEYPAKILSWIKDDGWTPALHGFRHVLREITGGLNPVNPKSEFVGLDLSTQEQMISSGLELLKEMSIEPEVFIAPCHTFDSTTLEALKNVSNIRVISDTVADNVYKNGDFYYIPQQCGMARELRFPLTTFCYHPNYTTDSQFEALEGFLEAHHSELVSFNEIELLDRKRSIKECLLQKAYFIRLKLVRMLHRSK